jgi:hypothetical protein
MDFKKWIASCAFLSLGSFVFADEATDTGSTQQPVFVQGCPIENQFSPAYNQAGGVKLRDNCSDFYVSGSFIYWMANTDGFNESSSPFAESIFGGGTVLIATGSGNTVFVQPKFEPGFKVGLGYGSNFDDWAIYLEWTRLHQSHRDHFNSDASAGDVFILAADPYHTLGDKLNSKWKLDMDLLDFSLGRSFYSGKRVIFDPFLGIRAAWFQQRLDIDLSSSSGTPWATDPFMTTSLSAYAKSKNWGLGVRAGMNSQYLLGAGFRIDGKASFSLLFTRFTELKYFGVGTSLTSSAVIASVASKDINTVRPQAELGLGLGWGSYLSNRRCHIDFDVTYDFNMFWDQNMLRGLPDSLVHQTAIVPTDLYYHGPTFTARLDF